MAWNDHPIHLTVGVALASAFLSACSVTGPRESPLNEVVRDAPTVVDIYRGHPGRAGAAEEARARLGAAAHRTPSYDDADTQRYWSALEPLKQQFARVPNPDLVMVVYPHLAQGRYPVPGYVTTFPMYEQNHYALPGEAQENRALDLVKPKQMASQAPKDNQKVIQERRSATSRVELAN
ncbi:TIGR03751 family conjugal transfer lipoprotein [Hydrogenophaga atypica]|uniref:TIGR03751 family conjugal transfer lipoprotein n=1 Tax=Hydrogenophaga atypica TaxID=249409 RepID=A0ABW2QLT0_9BURK